MIGAAPFIGIIPVKDLDAARSFYAGTLGLMVKEETPDTLVIDAGGTMLRITTVGDFSPQAFTIAGWHALDIEATVGRLAESGVAMLDFPELEQDEHGIWTAPSGDRVAWFSDPDANVLSLTQFATSVVDEFWR
jgi:catechol 2,3-dioxygenase-like lactoylglutathione lyase family enzyme